MGYLKIENLQKNNEIETLKSSELAALGELWKDKKATLEHSGEYKIFIKKMQREWAIETGIIERLYSWDRGVTETLIEQGIDSILISHKKGINRDEAETIAKMIHDQKNIVEGLFSFVKDEKNFSEHYIRSMHAEFTKHQDYTEARTPPNGDLVKIPFLLKGKYKERANNPTRSDETIHEYCPPLQVKEEMERLVKLYLEYENKKIAPEILSAWVHHRFTQIHPFQDGNGRVARAIASLVFLKAGLFPLVMRDSDRAIYIQALEEADRHNLSPLVKLFTKRQRDSVLAALGIQQQIEQENHTQKIIENAIGLLKNKFRPDKEKIKKLYTVSGELHKNIETKLSNLQADIDLQLKEINMPNKETCNASIKSAKNGDSESHYFYKQIIEMAKRHTYYANLDHYKSWNRLIIYTGKIFEIVFSIHCLGHEDNEIMVVSGFTFERVSSEETKTGTESINTKACNQDIFQFNYLESEKNIKKRFEEWLNDSVIFAIAEWQKSII